MCTEKHCYHAAYAVFISVQGNADSMLRVLFLYVYRETQISCSVCCRRRKGVYKPICSINYYTTHTTLVIVCNKQCVLTPKQRLMYLLRNKELCTYPKTNIYVLTRNKHLMYLPRNKDLCTYP